MCGLHSRSPEQTLEAARLLGSLWPERGGVLALVGALGAGKTLFVRGLAEGLGVDPRQVTSPTFVIACHYPPVPGRPGLVHSDWYRVGSELDLEAAGLLDWLAPGSLLAVEWSDRFPEALPVERLELSIARSGEPSERRLTVRASGGLESVAAAWEAAVHLETSLETG